MATAGAKPKFTVAAVIAAIIASKGNLSQAARELACKRQTINLYRKRHPEIEAVIRSARDQPPMPLEIPLPKKPSTLKRVLKKAKRASRKKPVREHKPIPTLHQLRIPATPLPAKETLVRVGTIGMLAIAADQNHPDHFRACKLILESTAAWAPAPKTAVSISASPAVIRVQIGKNPPGPTPDIDMETPDD